MKQIEPGEYFTSFQLCYSAELVAQIQIIEKEQGRHRELLDSYFRLREKNIHTEVLPSSNKNTQDT